MSGASLILSLSTLQWPFLSSFFFFLKKLFKCLELFYLSTLKLEIGMHSYTIPDGEARTRVALFPGY